MHSHTYTNPVIYIILTKVKDYLQMRQLRETVQFMFEMKQHPVRILTEFAENI